MAKENWATVKDIAEWFNKLVSEGKGDYLVDVDDNFGGNYGLDKGEHYGYVDDKIHVFVERYAAAGYAQPATAAPAVDQNLVNTLRTLFDANPQLKAQVQALLAIVALQVHSAL